MGAERSQWQFPANEVGKVIGWSDDASPSNPSASKGLVNKGPFANLTALAGKQDASANLTSLAGMTSGTARDAKGRFDTVVNADAATIAATAPEFIDTVGFTSTTDDGGATYINPVTVNPGKTDQISVTVGATTYYYKRLHNAGEVDFAKHGMFLDGREESALFEDTFAVALDRGLSRLVMPGGRSVKTILAKLPEASFHVDLRGSTLLGDFNSSVLGATNTVLASNMMAKGTAIGDMTENGGLTAAMPGAFVQIASDNVTTIGTGLTAAASAGKNAASGYIGKLWSTPRRVFRVTFYGSTDAGYATGADPNVTFDFYIKTTAGAPANDTDGTLVGTLTFADTSNESATPRTIISNNQTSGAYAAWLRPSRASGTGLRVSAIQFEGASSFDLALSNCVIDGQNNTGVTKLAERRILDIEGYRKVRLFDGAITRAARAGLTERLILNRQNMHTRIHNCLDVVVDGFLQDANSGFEELHVTSSDEITQYHIARTRLVNKIGSGSAISVYNCGPGRVTRNFVQETSGSCFNILSRYAEVDHNVLLKSTNSIGIDLKEGNIYSHGSWVHHNRIGDCGSVGIVGCGNGIRIEDNVFTGDCLHGIDVTSQLGTLNTTHGAWLDGTLREISGVKIRGNRVLKGFNVAADGSNSNVRVLGEPTAQIEAEIHVTDETHSTTLTENNVWLRQVRHVKISGKMMHGRTALVSVDQACGTIDMSAVKMEPQAGQTVSGVIAINANINKLIFNQSEAAATFDVGFRHVGTSGTGTYGEVQFNNSPTVGVETAGAGGVNVPANTRIMRNGKITKRDAAFAHADVAANGRNTVTIAVPGARTTDDAHVSITTVSALVATDAWVSADNVVTFEIANPTAAIITASTVAVRVAVTPDGYSV